MHSRSTLPPGTGLERVALCPPLASPPTPFVEWGFGSTWQILPSFVRKGFSGTDSFALRA
jgi:hypothetical protein